jgi:DNA-directed RNA polymerase subunit RPC12/RpoP
MSIAAMPARWRALVSELNGGRIPDGTPGIRDVNAPCDHFEPAGEPFEHANGSGSCMTDGHYICSECVHIEIKTLRRRQDRCEECGSKDIDKDGNCHACVTTDGGSP